MQKEVAEGKNGLVRKRNKSSRKSKTGVSNETTSGRGVGRRVSFSNLNEKQHENEIAIRIEPKPMVANSSTETSKSSGRKSASSPGGVIWGSNFNHVMSSKRSSSETVLSEIVEKQNETKDQASTSRHLRRVQTATARSSTATAAAAGAAAATAAASSSLLSPRNPMDVQTARALSQKSFLLELKDLMQNYIDYNGLFVGKEKMTVDVISGLDRPKTSSLKKVVSCLKKRPQTSLNGLADTSGLITNDMDWKKSLPNIYYALECVMTPNYRETVRPPVSTKLKYSNMDFLEFKAKLKRNSVRLHNHRRSSSITHLSSGSGGSSSVLSPLENHINNGGTTSSSTSESDGSSSVVVSNRLGGGLRRNSSIVSKKPISPIDNSNQQ